MGRWVLLLVILTLASLLAVQTNGVTLKPSKAACKIALTARATASKAAVKVCKGKNGKALLKCKAHARGIRKLHTKNVLKACAKNCSFQKHLKSKLLKKQKVLCRRKATKGQRKRCMKKRKLLRKKLHKQVHKACLHRHKKRKVSCYSAKRLYKRAKHKAKLKCALLKRAHKKKKCKHTAARKLKYLIIRVGKACKHSNRMTCAKATLGYKSAVALAKAKCSLQSSSFARKLCYKAYKTKKHHWKQTKARYCKIAKLRKKKHSLKTQASVLKVGILHLTRHLKKMQKLSMHSKACKKGLKKLKAGHKLCKAVAGTKRTACFAKLKKYRHLLKIKVCGLTKHQKRAAQKRLKKRKLQLKALHQKMRLLANKSHILRARLALAARKKKLKKLRALSVRTALKKLRRQSKSTKPLKKSALKKLIKLMKKKRSKAIARMKNKMRLNHCKIVRAKMLIQRSRCNRLKGGHKTRCHKKLKKLQSLAGVACAGKCKRARIAYQKKIKKYGAKCVHRSGVARSLCYRTLAAMTRSEYVRIKHACHKKKSQKCIKASLAYNKRVRNAAKRCHHHKGVARHLCVLWLIDYTRSEHLHMKINCKPKKALSRAAKLAQARSIYHSKLTKKIKEVSAALKNVKKHLKYFSAKRQVKLRMRMKKIKSLLRKMRLKLAKAKHMKNKKQLHTFGKLMMKAAAKLTKRVRMLLKHVQKKAHKVKQQIARRKKAHQNAQVRSALSKYIYKRAKALNVVLARVKKHSAHFSKKHQALVHKQMASYAAKMAHIVTALKSALKRHKHKLPTKVVKHLRQRAKLLGKAVHHWSHKLQTKAAKAKKLKHHRKKKKHHAAMARLYTMGVAALKAHRARLAHKGKSVAHLNKKIKALHLKIKMHKKLAGLHHSKLKKACRVARKKYIHQIKKKLKKCISQGGTKCNTVALLTYKNLKKC